MTSMIGPYELKSELGRGAMAKVWRAYDPKLEREVAIKEPLFDEKLSKDVIDEMAERFVREGKAAGRLNHPGIVTIYAADVYEGRPAIVMELIDGITLSEMLKSGPLNSLTTLQILDQLLDAVGYAHTQGVIHRDIKPDNIFLTTDGRVKLADFGIAHVKDSTSSQKTQVGVVLGTPGYMAPEQATGSVIDNRTDIFAIGTIAYEMLSGINPFGATSGTDSTTLLYRIVHEAVPDLPLEVSVGLDADLRPAILAALYKSPDYRPQDAQSFKAMLHGAPTTTPSEVPQAATSVAPVVATPAQVQVPQPMQAQQPTYAQSVPTPQQTKQKKWMPYALVGAAGIIILIAVFIFATSGSGGVVTGTAPVQGATSAQLPNQSAQGTSLIAPEGFIAAPDDLNDDGADTTDTSINALSSSDMNSPTFQIFPDSNKEYLTSGELNGLTKWEASIARNEIYARHGYVFKKNMKIKNYFMAKSWYKPKSSFKGADGDLNRYELANKDLIVDYEKSNGW